MVSPYYDSLLAKIIAHGPDRDTAADRLSGALGQLQVAGVPTSAGFVRAAVDHHDFRAARVSTDWIAARGLPDYLEAMP